MIKKMLLTTSAVVAFGVQINANEIDQALIDQKLNEEVEQIQKGIEQLTPEEVEQVIELVEAVNAGKISLNSLNAFAAVQNSRIL